MSSQRGSRTDSSSGLMSNLTPTEELDNEPVFIENVAAQSCSRSVSNGSLNQNQAAVTIGCRSREEDIYEDLCYVNLRVGSRVLEVSELLIAIFVCNNCNVMSNAGREHRG